MSSQLQISAPSHIKTYTWNNISSSQVFGRHPLQQPALKDFKVSNVSWGAALFTGVASEFYFPPVPAPLLNKGFQVFFKLDFFIFRNFVFYTALRCECTWWIHLSIHPAHAVCTRSGRCWACLFGALPPRVVVQCQRSANACLACSAWAVHMNASVLGLAAMLTVQMVSPYSSPICVVVFCKVFIAILMHWFAVSADGTPSLMGSCVAVCSSMPYASKFAAITMCRKPCLAAAWQSPVNAFAAVAVCPAWIAGFRTSMTALASSATRIWHTAAFEPASMKRFATGCCACLDLPLTIPMADSEVFASSNLPAVVAVPSATSPPTAGTSPPAPLASTPPANAAPCWKYATPCYVESLRKVRCVLCNVCAAWAKMATVFGSVRPGNFVGRFFFSWLKSYDHPGSMEKHVKKWIQLRWKKHLGEIMLGKKHHRNLPKSCLVGGWTNPSEKYARQNGNLPQIGVKKIFETT